MGIELFEDAVDCVLLVCCATTGGCFVIVFDITCLGVYFTAVFFDQKTRRCPFLW